MPAQKRSTNLEQDDDDNDEDYQPYHYRHRRRESRRGCGDQITSSRRPVLPLVERHHYEQQQQDQPSPADQCPVEQNLQEDSDGIGTDPEAFDEVVAVLRSELRNNDINERHFFAQLFEARKDVECPICLGIIKKTRTVMGCLHRFCQECIDKSMRLGNNECPACRIHCASRRSLRDDLEFDALIGAIYPDVKKYEEEELVFHEEDKNRNEQLQASIAQISRRQSEALNKRHKLGKDTDDVSPLRVPRSSRNAYTRRRNNRITELEGYDGNERENEGGGNDNHPPTENCGTEMKQRRHKRQIGAQSSTTSPPAANTGGGCFDNSLVQIKEEINTPYGHGHYPETLTWGRGGARSGGASGSRSTRGTARLSKLIDHLESAPSNDNELSDVYTPHGSASAGIGTGVTPQLSNLINHLEGVSNNYNESDVHTTHGGASGSSITRDTQLYNLIDHLESVPKNDNERVAHERKSQAEDILIPSVEISDDAGGTSTLNSSNTRDAPTLWSQVANLPITRLQILEGQETQE